MKKVLYTTTALLAAGMITSEAQAAEPSSLSLGGFRDYWGTSADQDRDFEKAVGAKLNTVDVMCDGEIFFEGDTTLDNGIKVGVKVDMEAGQEDSDDPVDQAYVTVDTAYGRVMMGSHSAAAQQMSITAKDVGRLGVHESEFANLVVNPNGPTPGTIDRLNSSAINTSEDSEKITYMTPTYYGFTMGASYIPGAPAGDLTGGDDQTLAQGAFENGYSTALTYSTKVSGVGVDLSGQYANFNVGGQDRREEFGGGMDLSYMGFSLAGGYRQVEDPDANPNVAASGAGDPTYVFGNSVGSEDGDIWDASLSYEAGPYGVSLAYQKSSVRGEDGNTVDTMNDDEVEMYLLSGKYNMGPGVDTFASFGHMDYSDETPEATNKDKHNEGWAFVTGLALAF